MKKKVPLFIAIILLLMAAYIIIGSRMIPERNNSEQIEENGFENQADNKTVKVQLHIMIHSIRYYNELRDYFTMFHDKILAEHDMDIEIVYELLESENYSEKLEDRLRMEDAPDLFLLPTREDWDRLARMGYLMDLSGEPFTEKLYEGVKEIASQDGNIYALPLETEVMGFIYNKDILDACALTLPETYNELVHAVSVLRQKDYIPFELGFRDDQWNAQVFELILGNSLAGTSNLQNWLERMNGGNGSYGEITMLFQMLDMLKKNRNTLNNEYNVISGASFFEGKTAMWIQSSSSAGRLSSRMELMNLGFAALPTNDDSCEARLPWDIKSAIAVSSGTKEKEAALLLMDFLLDETESGDLFKALNWVPISKTQYYSEPSYIKEIADYIEAGRIEYRAPLPEGLQAKQGKLFREYVQGMISEDAMIMQLDETHLQSFYNN